MSLVAVFQSLQEHHVLRNMTFEDICQYTRLVKHLESDILLPQPIEQTTFKQAPDILPQGIGIFLSKDSWDILKDYIWGCKEVALTKEDYGLFKLYGWELGLTGLTIYPPQERACCTNIDCENFKKQLLKKEKTRSVLVFTLAEGVQPATAVQFSCGKCDMQYHNNFSVQDKVRTYYPGIPQYIQVNEHHYIEHRVVRLWVTSLLLGWVSASNSARSYDLVFTDEEYVKDGDWQFVPRLTTEDVWDAFVIFSLLDDKRRRNRQLQVNNDGENKD
ncbi:hypothetical protein CPB84DRAFT_1835890 [Gymnopilus junonius]|uniref:CxC5 like cysteine cluster associated with KDZ domain-containing protein n=1 Tax=Gymnopilus junonius TaxID=109634 RepID=A0A9P5NR56_GYMJU|nr:hypothetical protein CPB84DRAFT_1835890 [Gymnopilus junonius]